LITALPLNHVNALAFSSMGMILTGGCIVQLDRFKSAEWWSTVIESRATLMHYLGVMPAMLLQMPPHSLDRSHSLRFGFGGGVRGALHAAFEERFGVPLIEAWAMTETGGAGTISTHAGERHVGSGCIGQPSARYAEAEIADCDGKPSPVDAVGELVVRATGSDPRRGFFSGYYKDRAATESAWQGGWLHTGDLARRGADGALFFVGRRKQMIRRSGENISAAEVEAVLAVHPSVKEAAVVPVPDEIREEEVFAFIVVPADVMPTSALVDVILRAAAERLAYYKLPGYFAFVDSLPVTATQKPRYGVLAELARSLLDESSPRLHDVRRAKRNQGPARL
jgi:acyl-CoA synthetase (AMP-forming)/AMP-acid ligase II